MRYTSAVEKRRGGGFRQAGSVDPRSLGLPARDAKRLALEGAWGRAAGGAIARVAHAADLKRGVVEIDVVDGVWARELAPLLPRIVGRMARELPELGIRKFRLRVAGEGPRPLAAPAPPDDEPASLPAGRDAGPAAPATPAKVGEVGPGDLIDLARRYLARAEERRRGG